MSSWVARPFSFILLGSLLGVSFIAQAATVPQNFGTVAVGSTSAAVSMTFTLPCSPAPTFKPLGAEFQAGTGTCNSGVWTLPVTFSPHYAGLRRDGMQAWNGQILLAVTAVQGVGNAPELTLFPAALTTFTGSAPNTSIGNPQGVVVDAAGGVYIVDSVNDTVRYVNPAGTISTIAGTGNHGFSGDGGPANSAQLDIPSGVAVDGGGNVFIADTGNNRVRRVDAVSGFISTVVGNGTAGFAGDAGLATSAELNMPQAVAVGIAGELYIADTYNNRIRKVDTSGNITTVVGGGSEPMAVALSPVAGASVSLYQPGGLATDSAGNLFIADSGDNVIGELTTAGAAAGKVQVVAGLGTAGFSGDGGPATSAQLNNPLGVAVDAAGNIYISDSNNYLIRMVANGVISTVAGVVENPSTFYQPGGIGFDGSAKLYVADQGNHRVEMLNLASGSPITFPNTIVGSKSVETVTAVNSGNAAANFTAVGLPGSFVQQSSGQVDCSGTTSLTPGSSCSAAIAFAPATVGLMTGNLQFSDNSGNTSAQQTISLTGTGLPAPIVWNLPATVAFGSQTLGSVGSITITVSNTGAGALAIDAIALNGTNTSDFEMTSTCGSTVAPGGSCTVVVTFSPHGLGARSATLTLNDDAVGGPQIIPVSGTGTSGAARLGAIPIAIFGTGISSSGALTGEGSGDTHWTITSAADWKHPGPIAYVVTSASLPSSWLANGPHSSWIAPTATGTTALAAGPYVYHTTFDLSGVDASTAVLSGAIAADDVVTAELNGVPVAGFQFSGAGTLTPFTIGSGFVSGVNRLDFVVTNNIVSATGVRVEIAGTTQRIAAVPIAAFGTGVTRSGSPANQGSVDANYTLETSPGVNTPAPSFVVPSAAGWAADGPNSQWIAPSVGGGAGSAAGIYDYKTSFDLTGLNPATAVLVGQLAAAGSVTVKLNGSAVSGISATGGGNLVPFQIGSGFTSGVNVLEFVVNNAIAGPSGLRVDLSGSAQPIGPAPIAVWGTGTASNGSLASDGVTDAHYFLETGGLIGVPGPAAYVGPGGSLPSGWTANGPTSKWITPALSPSQSFPAGSYTYRTTFDLTGLNANTAVLNGKLAAVGTTTLILNGVQVANFPSAAASTLQPFTVTSGFVNAVNTLEFRVVTNTPGATGLRVDLSGTAESEFGSGVVSLSTAALRFNSQKIGTTSAIQSATLTNTGTNPLQISGMILNGPAASDFNIKTTCGAVAPGATCLITATFAPTAGGVRTAFIALTDSAGNSPQVIELTGGGSYSEMGPVEAVHSKIETKSTGQAAPETGSSREKAGTQPGLAARRPISMGRIRGL